MESEGGTLPGERETRVKHTSSTPAGGTGYWPQSRLRQYIILLLLQAWPDGIPLSELYERLGEHKKKAIRQALLELKAWGVVVRVARGVYAISDEYKKLAERVKVEKLTEKLTCKESQKQPERARALDFLTDNNFIEKVKEKVIEIARERYGDLLEPVDYEVLGVLAERALGPGSSYIHDPVGEGLGWALQRLTGSSSYTGWELAESLRRLVSLGLVYVRVRERKARLDRGLLGEALARAGVEPWAAGGGGKQI